MKHGPRQAPGGTSPTTAAPASGVGPTLAAPRLASLDPGTNGLSLWENLFRNATPAQQEELLALASRQGFLYSHQITATVNGAKKSAEPEPPARWANLLAGRVDDLEPLRPQPLCPVDLSLDANQRDAVARAMSTPDIFLLEGLPGTGKSRVVCEILTQAAQRGEKSLFLAATSAAVDCVLEQIGGRDVLWPLRCLESGEPSERLAPVVRHLTLAQRVPWLRERIVDGAGTRNSRSGNACTTWPTLMRPFRAGSSSSRSAWPRSRTR